MNDLSSVKTTDVGAGVPIIPPRRPKPHADKEEEEVFASLDSVVRTSNSSEGVYYMFDYSDEDRRLMEAYVSASESSVDNHDLSDYDTVDGVMHIAISKVKQDSSSDEDDNEGEDRCSSLPVLPPKPTESDTSEDSDFVSASFWLRNRKEESDLISFDDSKSGTVKKAVNKELPPLPLRSDISSPPPPLPRRINSAKQFRSRQCVSLYADVKPKGAVSKDRSVDAVIPKESPPPLPKRPDEAKKEFEKHKPGGKEDTQHQVEETKISLGRRFDSLHVCLDPLENDDKDDGTYEKLEISKQKSNNNAISLQETNAVENSIYGQVWSAGNSDSEISRPALQDCKQCNLPEKSELNDNKPTKLSVALPPGRTTGATNIPDRNSLEISANSVQELENYYSDFPTRVSGQGSQKSGACGYNSDLLNKSVESALPKCDTSPVLPKRKILSKSDPPIDLKQLNAHDGNVSNFSSLSNSEHDTGFGATGDIPVAPPRRLRKTVAGYVQKNANSDSENKLCSDVAGLHSPPLPKRSHGASGRKMSEDLIDIPLALPPRKGAVRTHSAEESSQKSASK